MISQPMSDLPPDQQRSVLHVSLFYALIVLPGINAAINAVICMLISDTLKRVPEVHRKMEPRKVWLLMIPYFSVVWNFFVFQRVPGSLKSYFDSVGRTDVGDCGKTLGLWFSICTAASFIPMFICTGVIPSLILLILCLVKFNGLKNKIAA